MRLFAAIELSEMAREAIVDYGNRESIRFPDAYWMTRENLHVTVAFFGEVAASSVAKLVSALGGVVANRAAFVMKYDTAILAPPQKMMASMIWLGFQPCTKFVSLAKVVYDAARPCMSGSFSAKSPYPHVTLSRFHQPRRIAQTPQPSPLLMQPNILQVSAINLFSSVLRRNGPLYEKLATMTLVTPHHRL